MKNVLAFIPILFLSCYTPPPTSYSVEVPITYHVQKNNTLCQAAALWMISDFVASNWGGYYDYSFRYLGSTDVPTIDFYTESAIKDELMQIPSGMNWIPTDLRTGAEVSYGKFLYDHTYLTKPTFASMQLGFSDDDSTLNGLKSEIEQKKLPVVCLFGNGYENGHVVVAYGLEMDITTKEVINVLYNDPLLGKGYSASPTKWKQHTLLPEYYPRTLYMTFPITDARTTLPRSIEK